VQQHSSGQHALLHADAVLRVWAAPCTLLGGRGCVNLCCRRLECCHNPLDHCVPRAVPGFLPSLDRQVMGSRRLFCAMVSATCAITDRHSGCSPTAAVRCPGVGRTCNRLCSAEGVPHPLLWQVEPAVHVCVCTSSVPVGHVSGAVLAFMLPPVRLPSCTDAPWCTVHRGTAWPLTQQPFGQRAAAHQRLLRVHVQEGCFTASSQWLTFGVFVWCLAGAWARVGL
jgi:hypothetical protein